MFSRSSNATMRAVMTQPRTRMGGWMSWLVLVIFISSTRGDSAEARDHFDPPPMMNSATTASVNRHVLLQIHATITSSASCNSTNKQPPSSSSSLWILTIDELDDQQLQPPHDRHNHLMTTTMTMPAGSISSLFPLDKELFIAWQPSSSSPVQDSNNHCWQGTAGTSLALPLQQDDGDATMRTLIVALWHTTNYNKQQQRTLLARQHTQVPRTIRGADSSSLSRKVHLRGEAPLLSISQTSVTVASLLTVITAAVLLLSTTIVLSSFLSRAKRRVPVIDDGIPQEYYDSISADEDYYDEEDEAVQEENPSVEEYSENEKEEEKLSDQTHEDDEGEEEEEQGFYQQDNPNAELDDEEEQNEEEETHSQWMLENLPTMSHRRGDRQDNNDAASNDSSSIGPAMPPVMERYVVRPKPARGITFETEMEHFKQLQLGSPQSSRTSRGDRISSPGVTHLFPQPPLNRRSFTSPSQPSFASLSQQEPWTSPLPWQASFMDSAEKTSQESASLLSATDKEESKMPAMNVAASDHSPPKNALHSDGENQIVAPAAESRVTIPENYVPVKPAQVPPTMIEVKTSDELMHKDTDEKFVNLESMAHAMGCLEHNEEGSAIQDGVAERTCCRTVVAGPTPDERQPVTEIELHQTDGKETSDKTSSLNLALDAGITVHLTPKIQNDALAGKEVSLKSSCDKEIVASASSRASVAAAVSLNMIGESTKEETFTEKMEEQHLPTKKSTSDTTSTHSQDEIALIVTESRPVLGGRLNASQSRGAFLPSQQEEYSLAHVVNLSQPSEPFTFCEMEDQPVSQVANISQHSDSQLIVFGLDEAQKHVNGSKPTENAKRDQDGTGQENLELTSEPLFGSLELPNKPIELTEKVETAQTILQTSPCVAASCEPSCPDVKLGPVPQQLPKFHKESTDTTPCIPRVTPPYEKPVSDIVQNCESFSDIQAPILESIIVEGNRNKGVASVDEKSPHPRSEKAVKSAEDCAPSSEPQFLKKFPPDGFTQLEQNLTVESQKGTNDSSPSFTYVSTLSPDSRASTANWTESRDFTKNSTQSYEGETERKTSAGRDSGASRRKCRLASEEKVPADHQRKTTDSCGKISQSSKPLHVCRDDGEVEVLEIRRSDPVAFLPEIVLSDSLRNVKQDFEAMPVWQFSNEEAVKPVDRKRRRRPSRKPAREKAPFMSPASNTRSTSRPEAKRKLIDLTDFRTPPLQDHGAQSKRRGSSSKTPPRKPEKCTIKWQEFTEATDPVADWSESKSLPHVGTFSRKKRFSGTKPAASTPP